MFFNQWILRLLDMSFTASIVILIIFPIRLLLKRTPKVFSFLLWVVVFFRLLCPVSITSNISIFGFLEVPVVIETNTQDNPHSTIFPAQAEISTRPAMDTTANEQVQHELPTFDDKEDLSLSIASMVWCFGAGMLLFRNLLQFIRLYRKLTGATLLRKNIYLVDHLQTSVIIGIIKPRIYLPSNLSEREQAYIIAHEEYHIHRGDQIYKLVSFIALCIHWFNPLVWLAVTLFERDMEMSCDEGVLAKLDLSIRADYARSLLYFTAGRHDISGISLAFSKGNIKERVENVMTFRKSTPAVMMVLTLIVCTLSGCLSTDPNVPSNTASQNDMSTVVDEAPLSEVAEASYQGDVTVALMPIDWTFNEADVPVLSDSLDNSDYLAIYVDQELSMRIRTDSTVEMSYDDGASWESAPYDLVDAEDYSTWLLQNDPIPGYSMKDLQARLKNGAEVRHIVFSDGKELYIVIDKNGVQLELVQEEKIESILIDGQRIMLTSTTCNPYRLSTDLCKSFESLLKTCNIISSDEDNTEWVGIIEHLQKNGAEFY
ncbi:M56 family metallopeptidase [Candidatus Pseudoscillospira sp. SGI.172]|uniref:M56 family metallopeptidase n=1 Tax=Candidatus Pseudoscillospira sp. SGI.172 TaxID=3420582 RepID=UPI003D00716F